MIKVDDILNLVDRAGEGRPLTPAECKQISQAIIALNNRVVEYERITNEDAKAMKKATVLFKRAKGWPAQMMPTLSELIEWLMDRSLVENNFYFQKVIGEIAEKLDKLGEIDLTENYEVTGGWLIDMNTRIINALSIGRPPTEGDKDGGKRS